MKVVALISGGKDSILNILHCISNGHEVVALANLCPKADDLDELDSFMYQTVGHTLLPVISECLDLPLIRHELSHNAHVGTSTLVYDADEADVEDLMALLKIVSSRYPEIRGVSTGAILSNYQRIRVENVCSRLGWTCLSYLWRRDQLEILHELEERNFQAILVKVAGIGLDGKHLNKTTTDLIPYLKSLHAKYGFNIAGEGGEFETIVTDCPLFKQRIVIDSFDIVADSQASYMTNIQYHIENKSELDIPRPASLETPTYFSPRDLPTVDFANIQDVCPKVSHCDGYFFFTGLVCRSGQTAAEFFGNLRETVLKNLTFADIIMTHVYLSDMAEFAEFNDFYSKLSGTNHPSSRSCVGLRIPGIRFFMDILAVEKSKAMLEKMHVQSISYWAPANIGPYSQAVHCIPKAERPNFLSVSGQIGLIPQTMQLPRDVHTEIRQSLKNLSAVISAAAFGESDVEFNFLHDQADSIYAKPSNGAILNGFCYFTELKVLQTAAKLWVEAVGSNQPMFFIQVSELPRCSNEEWELQLLTPANMLNSFYVDEDGDFVDNLDAKTEHVETCCVRVIKKVIVRTGFPNYLAGVSAYVASSSNLEGENPGQALVRIASGMFELSAAISIHCYHTSVTRNINFGNLSNVSMVPVEAIFALEGTSLVTTSVFIKIAF